MNKLLKSIIDDMAEWYGIFGLTYSVSRDGTPWLTVYTTDGRTHTACAYGHEGYALEFLATDMVSGLVKTVDGRWRA